MAELATSSGPFRWVFSRSGVVPAAAFLLIAFFCPLLLMFWYSISEPVLGLQNYDQAVTSQTALIIIIRTLKVSAIVAIVSVLLSYPYAYLMTIVSRRKFAILTLVVLIPYWTSLMARTYAWIVLLEPTGPINQLLGLIQIHPINILGTEAAVVIGMTQSLMPFAVFPLYTAMRKIDKKLILAANSLGAKKHTVFFSVFLPLSMPGVIVSLFIVFVLSLGYYVTPDLLGSPQSALLSQYIAVVIGRRLDFGYGGALAFVLVLLTLIVLLVLKQLTPSNKAIIHD